MDQGLENSRPEASWGAVRKLKRLSIKKAIQYNSMSKSQKIYEEG